MKKILFIALSLLALTSCTNSLNDNDQTETKKNSFYAMVTDSCYVIYPHGGTEPIFLNLNPTLEEMKKYNLSIETLEEMKKYTGMSRYIEGKRNDMFDIDPSILISFSYRQN